MGGTSATPPPGGKVVSSGGEFKTIGEGEVLTGTLTGSREIESQGKMQTRYLLRGDDGHEWILPGHYDLTSKLAQVSVGSRVWLHRSGTRKLRGRPQAMVTYRVVQYGPDGSNDLDTL